MSFTQLIIQAFAYTLALWLGLYLIRRDWRSKTLWLTSLGLISYAAGLGTTMIGSFAPSIDLALTLVRVQRLFLFLPAFFWFVLLIVLFPTQESVAERLERHPRPVGLLFVATIFFALGVGAILLSLDWLPRSLIVLAIGGDLLGLGIAIGMIDAFDLGEAFQPHLLRSLVGALFTAVLFGGQVLALILLGTALNFFFVILLVAILTTAVMWQTFYSDIQRGLDRIAFFRFPALRQKQQDLRDEAEATTRMNAQLDVLALERDELAQLTRQALSQLDNLPRLASSPLTNMPLVEERLRQKNGRLDTLARAAELKLLLIESIEQLKPRGEAVGTSNEWRHYNALYVPYVLGIKPHSRTFMQDEAVGDMQSVVDWLRTQVPRRTLYNWQTAASQLIARSLADRAQIRSLH